MVYVEADSLEEARDHWRERGQLDPISVSPIAFEAWPLWAKAMRHFATPQDKGMGDVVARMIGNEESAAFAAWFESTFKRKCGCKGRQTRWNRLYPL